MGFDDSVLTHKPRRTVMNHTMHLIPLPHTLSAAGLRRTAAWGTSAALHQH